MGALFSSPRQVRPPIQGATLIIAPRGSAPPTRQAVPRMLLPTARGSIIPWLKQQGELGTSKDIWGPIVWDHIHLRSICWKQRPTREEMEAELNYLRSVFENLPCPECSGHALEYFNTPPLLNLSKNMGYRFWAFNFHNSVNERLGKDRLSFEGFQEMYRAEHIQHHLC